MMSGYIGPVDEMPALIQWCKYLSVIKQVHEMHVYLIYGFERCPDGHVADTLVRMNIIEEDKFWTNAYLLGANAFGIRIVGLIVLLIRANQNKLEKLIITTRKGFSRRRQDYIEIGDSEQD